MKYSKHRTGRTTNYPLLRPSPVAAQLTRHSALPNPLRLPLHGHPSSSISAKASHSTTSSSVHPGLVPYLPVSANTPSLRPLPRWWTFLNQRKEDRYFVPVPADCDASGVGWLTDGRSGSLIEPEGRSRIQRKDTLQLRNTVMVAEQ